MYPFIAVNYLVYMKVNRNAVAEGFLGTLKTELMDEEDYRFRGQASQTIFEYIKISYNRQRQCSFINYMMPCRA